MPPAWSFSHGARQVAGIPVGGAADTVTIASSAPPDSQWAAELAANVRSYFAQQCRRYPGRVTQLQFTATNDASTGLTITLVAS